MVTNITVRKWQKNNFINKKDYSTDFAIGAYKTGQVFFLKTLTLIDFFGKITTSAEMFVNATQFSIEYCLNGKPRNLLPLNPILLQSRLKILFQNQISETDERLVFLANQEPNCFNYTMSMKVGTVSK